MSLICPNCSSEMNIANKFGVEIDHCPRCKGVWLDRGELEKIANIQDRYEDEHFRKYHYDKDHDDDKDEDDDYYKKRKHKKRGGFLGEIFDFDYEDDDDYYKKRKHKKRGGFLGEIFDFD